MIESLRSSNLSLPPEFWGSLSDDPSEQVRLLVLDALEGTSQARNFAALALSDPSDHVKLRAKEILDVLGNVEGNSRSRAILKFTRACERNPCRIAPQPIPPASGRK
jgi:hypothetical protein